MYYGIVSLEADPNIRDFSGRLPAQYKTSQPEMGIKDNYSEYKNLTRPKHDSQAKLVKHHSFLRKKKQQF